MPEPEAPDRIPDLLVGALATADRPGTVFRLRPGSPIAPALGRGQGAAAIVWHPFLPLAYGVSMGPEGRLLVWQWRDGRLYPSANVPSYGAIPCHLALDPAGQFLVVANYGSASMTVFRLDDAGTASVPCWLHTLAGRGPHPVRQIHAHPHHVAFIDRNTLLVNDAGTDRIISFTLDRSTGALIEQASSPMPPGTAPRHLAFLSSDRLAISGELNSTVVLATLDRDTATVNTVATAPSTWREDVRARSDQNLTSDIKVVDETIYIANRGYDTVAVLRANDKALVQIDEISSQGRSPQHLFASPSVVLAACQLSDHVTAWRRSTDGTLQYLENIDIPQPAWLTPVSGASSAHRSPVSPETSEE